MNIKFKDNETKMKELQTVFNEKIGMKEGRFMDHYDLETITGISCEDWKQFLRHPLVDDYITEELEMFMKYQQKQIIKTVKDKETSVGVGQVLNALGKTDLGRHSGNGETYIYCYIPLNPEQMNAPNVEILDHDIFKLGD